MDGIIGDCYRSVNPLPLSTTISLCGIEVNVASFVSLECPIIFFPSTFFFLVNFNFSDDKSLLSNNDWNDGHFQGKEERNVNQPSSINRLMNQLLVIILKFWCGVIRKEDCLSSCDEEVEAVATLFVVLFQQQSLKFPINFNPHPGFSLRRTQLLSFRNISIIISHKITLPLAARRVRRQWMNFKC